MLEHWLDQEFAKGFGTLGVASNHASDFNASEGFVGMYHGTLRDCGLEGVPTK